MMPTLNERNEWRSTGSPYIELIYSVCKLSILYEILRGSNRISYEIKFGIYIKNELEQLRPRLMNFEWELFDFAPMSFVCVWSSERVTECLQTLHVFLSVSNKKIKYCWLMSDEGLSMPATSNWALIVCWYLGGVNYIYFPRDKSVAKCGKFHFKCE